MYLIWQYQNWKLIDLFVIRSRPLVRSPVAYRRDSVRVGGCGICARLRMSSGLIRRVTEEGVLIGREGEGLYKVLVDTSHKRGRRELMEW